MHSPEVISVRAPARLSALRRSGLLDTLPEESFDRLTRLASRLLGVPAALVSLVDEDRQFFKSVSGLAEPWSSLRQVPLDYSSFCQHALRSLDPLLIEDARTHPLVHDSLAVTEGRALAYAGIPLTSEGQILGTFCVVDTVPRQWTEEEIQTLRDLASAAQTEIDLRRAERQAREGQTYLSTLLSAQQAVAQTGLDLEAVMGVIAERTRTLTGADAAVVELAEGEEIVYRAASGAAEAHAGLRLKIAGSIAGLCIRTGKILRSDDTEKDDRVDRAACRRVGARSLIVVPLAGDHSTVGVLKVYSQRVAAFSEPDVHTLELMTQLLGAALEHAQRVERERQLNAEQERIQQEMAKVAADAELNLARLEAVLAALPVGVFVTDPAGVVQMTNPAAAEIWGGRTPLVGIESYGEYRAKRADTGVPLSPEDWPIARAVRTGRTVRDEELEIEAFDGTHKTVLASGVVFRDAADRVLGGIAMNVDITERKRAEAARAHLAAIVDSSADAILSGTPDGTITSWNAGAERLFGYVGSEVIGRHVSMLSPPETSGEAKHIFPRIRAGEVVTGVETVRMRKDGSRVDVALTVSPVRNIAGRVIGFSAIVRDITDSKQAREVTERSEAKFRALIENATDVITILNEDGAILYESGAVERMLGYAPAELVGRSFLELTHPDDVASIGETFQRVLQQPGVPTPYHLRFRHQDGSYRYLEGISTNLLDHPAVRGIVANSSDITERVESERKLEAYSRELQRSNRELQDFAYIASHDLQEPLRKIQAFGDRLKQRYAEALGETGADYLERMQAAANRMQSLIQGLLSYSRVTSKAQPFEVVDLRQIAQGVAQDLSGQIDRSGGRLEVGTLPQIGADPLQVRQLLQNLIGNALKFHREGVPAVVRVSGTVAGGSAEIRVEDNGIGFDEQYLDRIFAPFERLHGRGTFEGTGMGLAICRKIAERHGGSITARSTPGEGTTFIVTLPMNHTTEGTTP